MKTTKKERRIPEGWRLLTPTEKIDASCMCVSKGRLPLTDTLYWMDSIVFKHEFGMKPKDIPDWIYIKPIKKENTNAQITAPPTSTPTTT